MREDKNAPIKWATMVPLIGGSAFGCYNATGTKPLYNMSYTPFAANESFFYRHWDEFCHMKQGQQIEAHSVGALRLLLPAFFPKNS